MIKQDPGIVSEIFRYTPRVFLFTMLFFCAGIFACTAALTFVVDISCTQNANLWLPIYPESTVVFENHTFVRPFGVGITSMQLYTPNNETVVRNWYIDMRSRNEANPVNLLASMNYSVLSEPETGGSIIWLQSECAWN
ncbi:MAG: hypothetical protein H7X77_08480 [Anaerolineae bacterium]|nr:hypothetical protein [Anaerolineae bacterium]